MGNSEWKVWVNLTESEFSKKLEFQLSRCRVRTYMLPFRLLLNKEHCLDLWPCDTSWLACPALGEDLILLDQMDGDWQRWFLVTCPLWTGWLLLLYSIYNIQRHVSIKSLIFFKLWITRITLLVWMPGRFRTKMKNMVNKSPNKRESYKVHTINFLLLPSLPLPVHQPQPMGRPALPDLLLGLRASLRMPPPLSGGLGGIHFCYSAGYLLDWSRF